jgi:hypothetical protein
MFHGIDDLPGRLLGVDVASLVLGAVVGDIAGDVFDCLNVVQLRFLAKL